MHEIGGRVRLAFDGALHLILHMARLVFQVTHGGLGLPFRFLRLPLGFHAVVTDCASGAFASLAHDCIGLTFDRVLVHCSLDQSFSLAIIYPLVCPKLAETALGLKGQRRDIETTCRHNRRGMDTALGPSGDRLFLISRREASTQPSSKVSEYAFFSVPTRPPLRQFLGAQARVPAGVKTHSAEGALGWCPRNPPQCARMVR